MLTYKITVYREWKEYGEIEIQAESEDEAQEQARDALNDDDDIIEWHGENMEPGNQDIESIAQV